MSSKLHTHCQSIFVQYGSLNLLIPVPICLLKVDKTVDPTTERD